MYKRILAALDVERRSDGPIISAHRLAREWQAELRAVSVVRTSLLLGKGFFTPEVSDRKGLIDEAQTALRSRLDSACQIECGTDVIVGSPSDAITNVAEQRGSDLVVLGTKPRHGAEWLLGTTATNILRLGDRLDIYACHRTDPGAPARRILLAIDGSRSSSHVLSSGQEFARLAKASGDAYASQVVCVVPDEGRESEAMVARARNYLVGTVWDDLRVCVRAHGVVDGLAHAVREHDSDLLVIGSGNHIGLGWAIGSTSNSLLHEIACDVLVTRSSAVDASTSAQRAVENLRARRGGPR